MTVAATMVRIYLALIAVGCVIGLLRIMVGVFL